ncbi:MAG: hypothetical protein AAGJ35_07780, partial [Myxococcota bacterium]
MQRVCLCLCLMLYGWAWWSCGAVRDIQLQVSERFVAADGVQQVTFRVLGRDTFGREQEVSSVALKLEQGSLADVDAKAWAALQLKTKR